MLVSIASHCGPRQCHASRSRWRKALFTNSEPLPLEKMRRALALFLCAHSSAAAASAPRATVLGVSPPAAGHGGHGSPWPSAARARASALVANMTLAEKLSLLQGGDSLGYAGALPAIPRLGIPAATLEDGPQGVGDGLAAVTVFPSALTAAQSWDLALLQQFGAAMGAEQFGKGTSTMLGPGTNLARVPLNGRLYEYLSEEPALSGAAIAALVRGVQSNVGVAATVKHFLANSQEWNRGAEDALLDERTLHEMYLPSYLAAAAAGAGAFMLGVNKIRGVENSANAETIGALFAAGFEGYLMTDWAGIVIPDAGAAALAGTSVEMPRGYQYQYLPQFIANGSVPLYVIDGLVTRVLTTAAALGLLDTPAAPSRNTGAAVATPAHAALARTLAARGAVLLKNAPPRGGGAPLLPLTPARLPRGILVLGDAATVTGCGSGEVRTPYVVTPLQGLYAALAPNASRPVNCSYAPGVDFFQDGAPCRTVAAAAAGELPPACCALCTATAGCNAWTLVPAAVCPGQPAAQPAGQCFLKPDTAGERPHAGITSGTCAPPPPTTPPLSGYGGQNASAAAALAAAVDAVIFVAATPAAEPQPGCEGVDRLTLALPPWQDAMIAAVAAVNPRLVVVTRTGGAALMPWLADVPAVLHTGLAGQEAGAALADVLLGAENPAGRLTVTFPASDARDAGWLPTNASYPGVFNASGDGFWQTRYDEGLLVGYRHYDANASAPQPLFAFGHGLSYSSFVYSSLAVSGAVGAASNATVTLRVANEAGPAGRDTPQLYVAGALPGDPVRTLRGFASTGLLAPGEAADVAFSLSAQSLAYYDAAQGAWAAYPPGQYALWVGASSRDLRLEGAVEVQP